MKRRQECDRVKPVVVAESQLLPARAEAELRPWPWQVRPENNIAPSAKAATQRALQPELVPAKAQARPRTRVAEAVLVTAVVAFAMFKSPLLATLARHWGGSPDVAAAVGTAIAHPLLAPIPALWRPLPDIARQLSSWLGIRALFSPETWLAQPPAANPFPSHVEPEPKLQQKLATENAQAVVGGMENRPTSSGDFPKALKVLGALAPALRPGTIHAAAPAHAPGGGPHTIPTPAGALQHAHAGNPVPQPVPLSSPKYALTAAGGGQSFAAVPDVVSPYTFTTAHYNWTDVGAQLAQQMGTGSRPATCRTQEGDLPCTIPEPPEGKPCSAMNFMSNGQLLLSCGIVLFGGPMVDATTDDSGNVIAPYNCYLLANNPGSLGKESYGGSYFGGDPSDTFGNGTIVQCDSPLVFDLSGTGIATTERRVRFDLSADGNLGLMHDLYQGMGLLVFDAERDGDPGEDGRGLFGNYTDVERKGKLGHFKDGFKALEAFVRRAEDEGILPAGTASSGRLGPRDLRRLEKAYGLAMRVGGMRAVPRTLEAAGVREILFSGGAKRAVRDFDGRGDALLRRAGAAFVRSNGSRGEYADVFFLFLESSAKSLPRGAGKDNSTKSPLGGFMSRLLGRHS